MAESNLSCGPRTVKYTVFIFNLLFFISGLVFIAIGGVVQGFFSHYVMFFENQYETPAVALIIVGAVILVVSFFGCCGAQKENVCMLRMFSVVMFTLLVCEVAAAVAVLILRSDVEELVENNMKTTLKEYDGKEGLVTDAWDELQRTHKCCGVTGPKDWANTTFGIEGNVPSACCIQPDMECGKGAQDNDVNIFKIGCYDALKNAARHNLGAILGSAAAIVLIQMVGIWMSCCLIKSVRERYEIL